MPRKAAYFLSIRDSRRPELRGDELCAFTWERLRNDANVDLDYMERADPSEVLGDVCHFRLSKRRSDRVRLRHVLDAPRVDAVLGATLLSRQLITQ